MLVGLKNCSCQRLRLFECERNILRIWKKQIPLCILVLTAPLQIILLCFPIIERRLSKISILLSYDCSSSVTSGFIIMEFDQVFLVTPHFSWTPYVAASVSQEVLVLYRRPYAYFSLFSSMTPLRQAKDTDKYTIWQLYAWCSYISAFCRRTENEKFFPITIKICQRDNFRLRWLGRCQTKIVL